MTKTRHENVYLMMFAATLVNVKGITNVLELGKTMVEMGADHICPKGFWIIDPKTGKEYYSPNYLLVFGYTREEYPDDMSGWRSHIFPEDEIRGMADYQKHVDTKGDYPYNLDVRYYTKSKNIVTINCSGTMDFDDDGNPLRMLGTHL